MSGLKRFSSTTGFHNALKEKGTQNSLSSTAIGFKKIQESKNKKTKYDNFVGDAAAIIDQFEHKSDLLKIDNLADFLKKKQAVKKEGMRRLRCKVMKLTDKILTYSCGHLKYMKDRGSLIDLRVQCKNMHQKNHIIELTKQGRRQFDTLRKNEFKRPENLHDTKNLNLPKLNLVEELCEFLSREEIDEISDDPFFYLSNSKGKPLHEELLNVEDWNKVAGLTEPTLTETNINIYKFVCNGLRVLKKPEPNLENFYLKPRDYEIPVRVKWHNNSDETLSYYWTNRNRLHNLMIKLEPGQSMQFQAYAGHPWTVRTDEGVIAYFSPLKTCQNYEMLAIVTDKNLESSFVKHQVERTIHEFNVEHAYEKNKRYVDQKYQNYRITNHKARQTFNKNYASEMHARDYRHHILKKEVESKEQKADQIIQKVKDNVAYCQKEKIAEEKRQQFKIHANRAQQKDEEDMTAFNELLKNHCKQHAIQQTKNTET